MERTGEISIPAEGSPLPGTLSLPARGHGPGLVVLHEAEGVGDWLRGVCDRLARAGFVALAPDLYRGRCAGTREEAERLAGALAPQRVTRDLEACVQALLNEHGVEGPRVAAVGFGLGGHLALVTATLSPRVGAVVDVQGFFPRVPFQPDRLDASVLGIFGEKDEWVTREHVDELGRQLTEAGARAHVRVEPSVGHGFLNPARPLAFDARAADACWDRMLAFLRAELR